MDGADGRASSFGGLHDMSASPSLIADAEGASPSAPSSPSFEGPLPSAPSLLPAEHAELLRLREEVAQLRWQLSGNEGVDGPLRTAERPPDKDLRCTGQERSLGPGQDESPPQEETRIRRSDWALRERAYRCARDVFMGADTATGTGRVVRADLLATMRQQEPEVAAFFESPRQHFRRLLVDGDPEGIIDWDDFVDCYVQQCKQSISAVKALEPERDRSPATASTRSPVLPLQRCSEIGRNVTCSSADMSPSHLQELAVGSMPCPELLKLIWSLRFNRHFC